MFSKRRAVADTIVIGNSAYQSVNIKIRDCVNVKNNTVILAVVAAMLAGAGPAIAQTGFESGSAPAQAGEQPVDSSWRNFFAQSFWGAPEQEAQAESATETETKAKTKLEPDADSRLAQTLQRNVAQAGDADTPAPLGAEPSAAAPVEPPSLTREPSISPPPAPAQSASPSIRPSEPAVAPAATDQTTDPQEAASQDAASEQAASEEAPAPSAPSQAAVVGAGEQQEAAAPQASAPSVGNVPVEVERDSRPLVRVSSPNAKCGEAYTVEFGDTLGSISVTLFQDVRRWRRVYEHGGNNTLIGPNPNALEVGMVLQLPPCGQSFTTEARAELRVPPASADAEAPSPTQPVEVPARAPVAVAPNGVATVIEMLTGAGHPPIVDPATPNGGMMRQLVEASFAASGVEAPLRIDVVNDWRSHLSVLLRNNKYEFGFPWVAPDCGNFGPDASDELRMRCEYVYSDPVYVVAVDLFGLADQGVPLESFADLQGKRVCRPDGWTVGGLSGEELDNIELVRAPSAEICFERLERGTVDFVSVSRFTGEKALADLGLASFVRTFPALTNVESLRLAAHSDNAQASVEWMRAFNKGLAAIKQTGEWDQIVSWHLKKFRTQR